MVGYILYCQWIGCFDAIHRHESKYVHICNLCTCKWYMDPNWNDKKKDWINKKVTDCWWMRLRGEWSESNQKRSRITMDRLNANEENGRIHSKLKAISNWRLRFKKRSLSNWNIWLKWILIKSLYFKYFHAIFMDWNAFN